MEEVVDFEEKGIFQDQIEEAKAFIDSQEFKDMIRKAKESRQRVMESKITHRTKIWLTAPVWREEDYKMKKLILTLSLIYLFYYLTFKFMWIRKLEF